MKIKKELKQEIKTFLKLYQELEKNYIEFDRLFIATPECKFFQPIYKIVDLYLKNLDLRLSEGEDWLSWFIYENDMGEKKLDAAGKNGKMKEIRTIEDLFGILEI